MDMFDNLEATSSYSSDQQTDENIPNVRVFVVELSVDQQELNQRAFPMSIQSVEVQVVNQHFSPDSTPARYSPTKILEKPRPPTVPRTTTTAESLFISLESHLYLLDTDQASPQTLVYRLNSVE